MPAEIKMVEVCGGKDKNPSREDMKNRILKIISCLAVSAALLLCLGTAEIFAQTANETQVQAAPAEQAKAKQLGWTANVAILEGCVASEERSWYLGMPLCNLDGPKHSF